MIKTALDLPALQRILAPLDLRPRAFVALGGGAAAGSAYRVDTDGGTVLVRVNDGRTDADVRYEGALLWHLGARAFPTPQPLRRPDGAPYVLHDGHRVSVFPWVPGRRAAREALTPDHTARVGSVLGRLHRTAAELGERRDGLFTFERIAARVESLRVEPRVADVLPELEAEVSALRASRAPDLPSGAIHGELTPDAVLWRGDEIAAVLRFEHASWGRFAYDLAVALLAWCWKGDVPDDDIDDARARTLVAAYATVRPPAPVEVEALLVEARVAALRFTVTRLTDVFLPSPPGAEAPPPGHDFREHLARLRRLPEIAPERVRAWCAPVN